MSKHQYGNSDNLRPRCSKTQRLVAGLVFAVLAGGGAILWLSANGFMDLSFWLGVCGFKQRHGLPCPGCGWTHASQLFLTGHPLQAFGVQPAAVFFWCVAVTVMIFALLIAVFGIEFGFLRRWYRAVGLKRLLIAAISVFVGGWLVTLARALAAR